MVVTQDLNGEYGHGGHMLFSHAVAESVEQAASHHIFLIQLQNTEHGMFLKLTFICIQIIKSQ